jgi:hypothetical protein
LFLFAKRRMRTNPSWELDTEAPSHSYIHGRNNNDTTYINDKSISEPYKNPSIETIGGSEIYR